MLLRVLDQQRQLFFEYIKDNGMEGGYEKRVESCKRMNRTGKYWTHIKVLMN